MATNCLQNSSHSIQQQITAINGELDYGIEQQCRFCLNSFSGQCSSIKDSTLQAIFDVVFKFELSSAESLPNVVCAGCRLKIDEFYLFHETVRANQIQLERDSNSFLLVQIKTEESDDDDTDGKDLESIHIGLGEPTVKADIASENSADGSIKVSYDSFSTDQETPITAITTSVEKPAPPEDMRSNEPIIEDDNWRISQFFNGIVCSVCSQKFETFSKLKTHCKKVHRQKASITCCEQKYFEKSHLIQHINSHVGSKRNYCELCKKNYGSKHILKLHNLQYHTSVEDLPFQCNKCSRKFCNRALLTAHLKTHVKAECSTCGRTMASIYSLKVHMEKMHSEKPRQRSATYVCDSCGRVYYQEKSLERHINTQHLSAKNKDRIQCPVCTKWVNNKHYLKVHIRNAHSGENLRVTCDICQQVCANKRAYYTHKQKVHVERKFECNICGKLFKLPKHLKEHRAAHLGQQLYTCAVCGYGTNYNGNLYTHMKNKHPEEFAATKAKRGSLQDYSDETQEVTKVVESE